MTSMRAIVFAALAAVLPMSGHAASIDLAAEGYVLEGTSYFKSGTFAVSDPFSGFLALDGASGSALSAFTPSDASSYNLFFDLDGLLTDTVTASGGSVVSVMTNTLEILFEGIAGTGAFASGNAVLVTFTDPDLDLVGGFQSTGMNVLRVSLLTEVAPVPLPAGGLLLLTGAGAFVAMRRKQKKQPVSA